MGLFKLVVVVNRRYMVSLTFKLAVVVNRHYMGLFKLALVVNRWYMDLFILTVVELKLKANNQRGIVC